MKNDIGKEFFIKTNLLNSHIKNTTISFIELTGYTLNLELTNINLKEVEEIEVVLKNVKTRDIFFGESSIKESIITVNLKSLNSLCSDNEFLLLLIIKIDGLYSFINPITKNTPNTLSTDFESLDSAGVKWYLRSLENGELRLSTIIKNSYYNSLNL